MVAIRPKNTFGVLNERSLLCLRGGAFEVPELQTMSTTINLPLVVWTAFEDKKGIWWFKRAFPSPYCPGRTCHHLGYRIDDVVGLGKKKIFKLKNEVAR